VLELGGYNPLIVLADADTDDAVEAAAFAVKARSSPAAQKRTSRQVSPAFEVRRS
jgi:acyl-CoA reductase-like NAD-dependent aldehyde dehydrogenase